MFYLGIDVSKAKLNCYLLFDEETVKDKVFANTTCGLNHLITWLAKNHAQHNHLHAVIEATGIYHELAANTLYEAGIGVSVANPAHVKYFCKGIAVRTKTDRVDSQLLARYGSLVKPSAWKPTPIEARTLQDLLMRHDAIMQDLQREKNQQEKTKIRATPELIIQSIADSIDFLCDQPNKIQNEINDHIDRHSGLKNDLKLLRSIPAVGIQTSMQMLAILHVNSFNTAEQVAAYLGVVPVEHRSGTSVLGRPKLSKAGPA